MVRQSEQKWPLLLSKPCFFFPDPPPPYFLFSLASSFIRQTPRFYSTSQSLPAYKAFKHWECLQSARWPTWEESWWPQVISSTWLLEEASDEQHRSFYVAFRQMWSCKPIFSDGWWILFLLSGPTCAFDHCVYFYNPSLSPRSKTNRTHKETGILRYGNLEENCISGLSRMFDMGPVN